MQLLPALDAGGVERGTLEIAAALVAAGHRAIVVSAGGRLLPELLATGAEHVECAIGRKSLLSLRHVWRLRRLIAGADIVHARSRLPAWLGWLAWRSLPGLKPRFLTTVHGLNSVNAYSAIMTRGERVIAVSATVRDHLLRHYPKLPAERLRVIPRGIDDQRFVHGFRASPAWRQAFLSEYPALATLPWLCLPGRGTRLKGHADGLRLLAALRAAGHALGLLLLGADQPGREAYLRELRRAAEQLGVAAQLVITKPRPDVREVFAESTLVLQLSRQPEAFGRTVVEALQLGVPVLGWAHGGVGELLKDLFPAGAVPAGDHAALLSCALTLLADRVRPAPFAGYRVETMQAATLALYAELIGPER